MRGKDNSAAFLPFCQQLGRDNKRVENDRNNSKDGDCLTPKQTK